MHTNSFPTKLIPDTGRTQELQKHRLEHSILKKCGKRSLSTDKKKSLIVKPLNLGGKAVETAIQYTGDKEVSTTKATRVHEEMVDQRPGSDAMMPRRMVFAENI